MVKRIFIFLLALCCAFSFVAQPASAAATTTVVVTTAVIGMAVAAGFGLYFASEVGYEAFGNNIHDAVISTPGTAGSEWWNRSLAGNIVLSGLDSSVKAAIWGCAAKAADSLSQSHQATTYTFTTTGYCVNPSGEVYYDYRNISYSFTSSGSPIYMVQSVYPILDNNNQYQGQLNISFVSSSSFKDSKNNPALFDNKLGLYRRTVQDINSGYWGDQYIKGYTIFSSVADRNSYFQSLCSLSSVSSAGGATAAYPTYGYDGVNLPNIDLTQPALVAEDGSSKVADLVAGLQDGSITWEDYIGTVAPGQTATITITDENGAAATYTLTNTGVGEKVETGTDVTEATQPVVVPGTGELTGTLADTDAKSFFDTLAETIAVPFADVIAKVQAIPAAISDVISQAISAIKPVSDVAHFAIDLRKYFPFCVPFDIYDFIMCLNAAPEAPVIEWKIPLPGGKTYPMEIDLSPYDSVAQLLRRLQLLLFCVGLAFKTRDLIKG